MMRYQLNRAGAVLPLLCSAAALAIVLVNIAAGVQPQRDEGASAHLFQLLIAAQLPFVALFAATADWRRAGVPTRVLILQVAAIAAAVIPVWLAGY